MQRGRKSDKDRKVVKGRKIEKDRKVVKGRKSDRDRKVVKNRKIEKDRKTETGKRTETGRKPDKRREHRAPGAATPVFVSQNFITDQRLIHRIVRLSTIGKNDTVLEIGTGKGHLTQALCKEAGYVYSVEIDRRLYENAKDRLAQHHNLKLICGDFLKYRLPAEGSYQVFANIPYCITTQIIEKLTQSVNTPKDIWLIMEKGAAKRFMGLPRETEKSLLLKVCWDMEIRYHFRREDFHPMPSVDSVLLHFQRKAVPHALMSSLRK